ncbi:MAG: 16S rRNA (cytosine(967)-C(5))-methyltransferase RsmB, partial [Lachnospiraceae bacterium]|nr:16S rRNA (cytosine(967)-C(5))-methyltransferase RsmB [Lachnospiraceae bacterium]
MTDVRMTALDILLQYDGSKMFLSDLVRASLDKYSYLEERDRAYIKSVVTGCVEKRIALDYIIDRVSKVRTAKMKKVVKLIIRMASYEIFFMDHIPARASVNEAVRLVKKKHISQLSGFVNAVTRQVSALFEEGGDIWPDTKTRYSCPDIIYSLLTDTYGTETADSIIKASDEVGPGYIRINTLKTNTDSLMKKLKAEGVEAEKTPLSENALKVSGLIPGQSRAFKDGLFTVQDLSGIASLDAAGIKEGMTVIDLCAAPGGKACTAAEYMHQTGRVLAFDISEAKTEKINENIARLGLENIETKVKDALLFDETLKETADLVIADLPCTGLGVMGRKVDIKYRIQKEDIENLAMLQRQILDNAVRYVKPGGKLLFSTCTITKEETVSQRDYIRNKPGFNLVSERQFLQGIDPCDGFYYAVFM